MKRVTSIMALGIIALFLGMAINPATADLTVDNTVTVHEQDISEFLPSLLDSIEKAKSYPELVNIVNSYINDWGRHPILTFLLEVLIQGIGFRNNLNEMRPLRRNALVLSWGFGNKLNPIRENKFQLYRPLTFWYYSGPAKLLVNSRTVIIDFQPFMVKSLTGRQVGLIRNFAGLYIHRQSTLWDKTWTFMAGRAMTVRGFDLSVLNVLNQ